MSTERMQFCFNCGDELGIYKRYHGDEPECCGKRECQRELQDTMILTDEQIKWYAEAIEDIESWAAYASEYFQDKHGLRAILAAVVPQSNAAAQEPTAEADEAVALLLHPDRPQEPQGDKVICPACCHEFAAIPENAQECAAVLMELVALKDLKDSWALGVPDSPRHPGWTQYQNEVAAYESRKDAAWAAARALRDRLAKT